MNDKLKQFYKDNNSPAQLSEGDLARVKNNIFDKLGTVVQEDAPKVNVWDKMRRMFLHSYILAPLVVILFVAGTTYASADSLPGDVLYPVKRKVEDVRLLVAPTQDAKLQLQETFAEKRLQELETLNVREGIKPVVHQNQKDKVVNANDSKDNSDDQGDSTEQKQLLKRKARHQQAEQDANQAFETLQQARVNWQNKGNHEKADEIQQKFNEFHRQLRGEDDGRDGGQDGRDENNDGEDSRLQTESKQLEQLTPLQK